MYGLIFSVVFVVAALLFMLVGALRGKKTAWQLSVTRILMSVIAAALAALVASLIAWNGAKALYGLVLGLVPQIGDIMQELPSGQDVLTALAAMIIAPVLFLLLYAIIRPIMIPFSRLIAKPIIKAMSKKEEPAQEAEATEDEALLDRYAEGAESTAFEATEAGAEAEALGEDELMAKYMGEEATAAPTKKKKKSVYKLEKNSLVGALCGALCSFVTLCILLVPTVGGLGVIDDMASLPLHSAAEADPQGPMPMIAEVLDASAHNAGSYTVKYIGGGLLYDAMTTYKVGEVKVTLSNESELVKALANAAIYIVDEEAEKEDKIESIREVATAFEETEMLPILTAELTRAAAGDWKEGKPFHGLEMPSLGKDFDPIVMSLVEAFAQSDKNTIKDDVGDIVEIMAVLMEEDALQSLTSNPLVMLSKEDTTSQIMVNLLNSPRLCILVDGITDFGVSVIMNAVNAKNDIAPLYAELRNELSAANAEAAEELADIYAHIFDRYGLHVTAEQCATAAAEKMNGGDILAWTAANVVADEATFIKNTEIVTIKMITDGAATITDKEAEAKALARAYAEAFELMNKMSGSSFGITEMVGDMGPVLDCFANTETFGREHTGLILKALLQSDSVHDKIGFTAVEASDTADSINESAATKTYAAMLNSLMLTVEMVEAASDPNVNSAEAVKKLLEDLTPESAEVLGTMATPNVLQNYGVPQKSSKPTSELMGDTFNNLAAAKGDMSEEEYEKESAAVSNMMSVVMTAGSGAVFGDNSSTGVSSDQFVDDILQSQVMSETLVDKVYGEGDTPTTDPLASNRKMSESERADFVTSLNNKWTASDKSETTKKEIVSIASIMNVKVEVTASGVTEVPAQAE